MSGLPLAETDTRNLVGRDMKSLVKKIRDLRHIGIEDSRTAHIGYPALPFAPGKEGLLADIASNLEFVKAYMKNPIWTTLTANIDILNGTSYAPPCRSQYKRPWNQRSAQLTMRILTEKDEYFTNVKDKDGNPTRSANFNCTITLWCGPGGQKNFCQAAPEPRRPSTNYQPSNNDNTNESYCQVKVSPNVVWLDISALNFPNLRHRHRISRIPIHSTEFHITGNENGLQGWYIQDVGNMLGLIWYEFLELLDGGPLACGL
ncbi:hypothetical protein GB937_010561 [Aspergillus fischeri]|nr:hypothetical protein GB937_010561 [Aspergillus fischeri]